MDLDLKAVNDTAASTLMSVDVERICCTSGSMLLSGSIGKGHDTWLDAAHTRLCATESLHSSIKSAKMISFTARASKLLQESLVHEVKASLGFQILMIGSLVLSEAANVLAPVLTLSLCTIIAKVKIEQSLPVSQAFASLTVLSLLGAPLVMFVQIVLLMSRFALHLIQNASTRMTPLSKL
ncbi:hypothetical protein B0O99DRAFT_315583 [Bisporella sp. PMI_857]|nr:hypothetical protein B0O99DRAFT_315583 [Bisporella sp. PMI_857]